MSPLNSLKIRLTCTSQNPTLFHTAPCHEWRGNAGARPRQCKGRVEFELGSLDSVSDQDVKARWNELAAAIVEEYSVSRRAVDDVLSRRMGDIFRDLLRNSHPNQIGLATYWILEDNADGADMLESLVSVTLRDCTNRNDYSDVITFPRLVLTEHQMGGPGSWRMTPPALKSVVRLFDREPEYFEVFPEFKGTVYPSQRLRIVEQSWLHLDDDFDEFGLRLTRLALKDSFSRGALENLTPQAYVRKPMQAKVTPSKEADSVFDPFDAIECCGGWRGSGSGRSGNWRRCSNCPRRYK